MTNKLQMTSMAYILLVMAPKGARADHCGASSGSSPAARHHQPVPRARPILFIFPGSASTGRPLAQALRSQALSSTSQCSTATAQPSREAKPVTPDCSCSPGPQAASAQPFQPAGPDDDVRSPWRSLIRIGPQGPARRMHTNSLGASNTLSASAPGAYKGQFGAAGPV